MCGIGLQSAGIMADTCIKAGGSQLRRALADDELASSAVADAANSIVKVRVGKNSGINIGNKWGQRGVFADLDSTGVSIRSGIGNNALSGGSAEYLDRECGRTQNLGLIVS